MTATLTKTTAPPVPLDETEAAALEGLAPMPSDLLSLRDRKLEIDQQMATLKEELDLIKGTFDKRLVAAGVVGFTLLGKVRARRSEYDHISVDQDGLRTKHPVIFKRFRRATPVVAIKIT